LNDCWRRWTNEPRRQDRPIGIIEFEAHRKLSYTWNVPFLDTVVTFTLTPTASGTRLLLVQSGFKPDQKREFGGARYGWKMMGGKLVDLLAKIP
jgi:uncharacterized protein YndB with AHSA1/START domain